MALYLQHFSAEEIGYIRDLPTSEEDMHEMLVLVIAQKHAVKEAQEMCAAERDKHLCPKCKEKDLRSYKAQYLRRRHINKCYKVELAGDKGYRIEEALAHPLRPETSTLPNLSTPSTSPSSHSQSSSLPISVTPPPSPPLPSPKLSFDDVDEISPESKSQRPSDIEGEMFIIVDAAYKKHKGKIMVDRLGKTLTWLAQGDSYMKNAFDISFAKLQMLQHTQANTSSGAGDVVNIFINQPQPASFTFTFMPAKDGRSNALAIFEVLQPFVDIANATQNASHVGTHAFGISEEDDVDEDGLLAMSEEESEYDEAEEIDEDGLAALMDDESEDEKA